MNIIMGRLSLTMAQSIYHLSKPTLQKIIQEIVPIKPHHLINSIVMFKNSELIYLDHNEKASHLGRPHHNGDLRNNTDKDLTPEFADFYAECDQKVLQSKQTQIFTGKTAHKDLGIIHTTATIHPVYTDHKDCKGILAVGDTSFSLSKQPFSNVLSFLHKGLASRVLTRHKYKIMLNGVNHQFYQREAECLLYLLVGLSNKIMANHMRLSPRTVENIVAGLKAKLNVNSKEDIAPLLITENFLAKLE